MKVIEVNYKTSNELSNLVANLNANNISKSENIEGLMTQETVKENITIDMVMNVLCSMGQEGLGPLQWWK
jgi:hypothetical protein